MTDSSVTVWVALKNAANVTLQVKSATGANVGNPATAPTIAVGRFLHIVAVTAPVSLTPEVIYTYDMSFFMGAAEKTLLDAVTPGPGANPTFVVNPISYPPYTLPSFALPPKNLNDLRIIHGSCRKPHGNGPDALSILDGLIAVTAQNAVKRPHQLLFTGDQIYADDVAASLLMQLMDASNTLLGTGSDASVPGGWLGEELLPGGLFASQLPPYMRAKILGKKGAGFTSEDVRNHLMTLGEYLCMYLFTWSDVLWPAPTALPGQDEVLAAAAKAQDIGTRGLADPEDDFKAHLANVVTHLKTLPKVRRALANVPTYMILDDHDVTDDWNMTLGFCNNVYNSELGRRVVQNALVAYALCQLWGNTPEQFQADPSNKQAAGLKLLTLLDGKKATDYDTNTAALQGIVSVHTKDQLNARKPPAVYHDQPSPPLTIGGQQVSPDSLVYNFVYTWPTHQLVMTDTRSWRSFPYGDDATGDLLPPDQIAAQIPLTPDLGDRALIVVVSTNAPPVQPIRGATAHNVATTQVSIIFEGDAHPDLYESWEIPSLGFDRLLTRITDKFKSDAAGIHYGQAILLSGDVHFSFVTRLSYNAKNRYGDTTAQPAQAVIAQFVASAFKNQTTQTLGFQRDGYFYVPYSVLHGLMNTDMTEGYVGWNLASGQKIDSGVTVLDHPVPFDLDVTSDEPTVKIFPYLPTTLKRAPDYRYRLDYLKPNAHGMQPLQPNPIPPLTSGDASAAGRRAALATFNAATGNYRAHNKGAGAEQLIGRNNISELTFDWGTRTVVGGKSTDSKTANHTVRWRTDISEIGDSKPAPDPDFPTTEVAWTTYTASLDPNDTNFPDKQASKEGP